MPLLAVTLLAAAGVPAWGKAPSSADVMRPLDTTPGALNDPKKLLQVNFSRVLKLSIVDQPAEIAFLQVGSSLGIEWGFMSGVDRSKKISIVTTGTGQDVLKELGRVARVHFEATGPAQMRVFPSRGGGSPAPRHTAPPVKRD